MDIGRLLQQTPPFLVIIGRIKSCYQQYPNPLYPPDCRGVTPGPFQFMDPFGSLMKAIELL